MSRHDTDLIKSLGISVAEFAKAIGKSRQAVSRGIKSDDDYFSPTDFVSALSKWKIQNRILYLIAKDRIVSSYPDFAEYVLSNFEGEAESFDPSVAGELTLVCGDIDAIVSDRTGPHRQLEEAIKAITEKGGQLNIIVNEGDIERAAYFEELDETNESVQAIPCTSVDLRMFSTYLLRRDFRGSYELFGIGSSGFITLKKQEAERIRLFIRNLIDGGKLVRQM